MSYSAGIIVLVLIAFIILSTLIYQFLIKRIKNLPVLKPLYIVVSVVIGIVIFTLMPIDSDSKSSFFSLFGLVITAVIGVSPPLLCQTPWPDL